MLMLLMMLLMNSDHQQILLVDFNRKYLLWNQITLSCEGFLYFWMLPNLNAILDRQTQKRAVPPGHCVLESTAI